MSLPMRLKDKIEKYNEETRHVAFLLNRNSQIEYIGFSRALTYSKYRAVGVCSIHAEQDVIQNIKHEKNSNLNYTLVVFRFNKLGELAMSKPCQNCLKHIKKYKNINKIYYSVENGFEVNSPLNMNIDDCYKSSGFKYREREKQV
jgi:deoxycytidylate deaminase